MQIKTYSLTQLRRIMPKAKVKQFISIPMRYKATNEKCICQIKDCKEEVKWATGDKKGNPITLCFGHGEEI